MRKRVSAIRERLWRAFGGTSVGLVHACGRAGVEVVLLRSEVGRFWPLWIVWSGSWWFLDCGVAGWFAVFVF